LQRNITLKEEHTRRVCSEIRDLGEQLDLDPPELFLTDIIARLHDVGRFEQYARYRTFSDRDSENHAALGIAVLRQEGVLDRFDPPVRDLILCAIRYHNRATLPEKETSDCLFYSRLLRDADKLDIFRVVTEHYHRGEADGNEAIELGLPDTPDFSEEVYEDLLQQRIVDIAHVKNFNDFKLLQVGWVYDINFTPTFHRIKERHYLEKIREVLPRSAATETVFSHIGSYLDERV
ncbi:MAG: HD domain-containing protein, partial [bacterium]